MVLTALVAAGVAVALLGWVVSRQHGPGPGSEVAGFAAPAARAPTLTGALEREAAAFIEGVIVSSTGGPLAGASVVAQDPERAAGRTRVPLAAAEPADAAGAFRLGPLAAGSHRVTAAADGFLPASREVTVKAGQTLRGIRIALTPGGFLLSGRVLDAGAGAIAGARVRVQLNGPQDSAPVALARTDRSGSYRLTVPPGRHWVLAESDGYAPQQTAVWMEGPATRDFRLIPAASIAGQVTRKGEPVPRAQVQGASRAFRHEAETDAEGRFRLDDLEPGDYHLEARAGNLAGRLGVPVSARLGTRTEGVLIEVEAGPAVSGRVFGPGGALVSGAEVTLWGNRGTSAQTTTDGQGAYHIEGLLPGPQSLSAATPDSIPARRAITVAGQDLTGIDLHLRAGAEVNGRVVDAREQPAGGALVVMDIDADAREDLKTKDPRVRADEEGRFQLRGLAPGAAAVHADGGARGRATVDLGKLAPGDRREVTLRLSDTGAHVSGTVRWKDGSPAAGIEVTAGNLRVDRGPSQSVTAADGWYRLGPFDPGALLSVNASTRSATVIDPPGHQRTVRIDGTGDVAGVDFILARSDQSIGGLVLDPDTRPLSGAVVGTSSRDGRVVTDPDGRFWLDGLDPGTHDLWAEYPGLVRQTLDDVPAGRTDVRLQLKRGALLAGAVEGAGRAAGACSVWAREVRPRRDDEDTVYRAVCAAAGTFELRGLPPATYDLHATTLDGRSGSLAGLAVADGEQRRGLRLRVGSGISALGIAVDLESRKPIAGARIHATVEGNMLEATTDAQGRFRVENLPRGLSVDLQVQASGYMPNSQSRLSPATGETLDFGTLPLLKERPGPPGTGRAGIVLSLGPEGALTVSGTVEDLPAAKAGVTRGDVVVGIDGHDLTNVNLPTAIVLIRGPSGVALTLQLRGPDQRLRTVRIVRG